MQENLAQKKILVNATLHCLWKETLSQQRIRLFKIL